MPSAAEGPSAWRKLIYQPHLTVGDVAAGQAAVPHRREEPASYPVDRDRHKTRPLAGPRRSPDSQLRSGYAFPSSRIWGHFLILIDAHFSSCSPRRTARRFGRETLAPDGRVEGVAELALEGQRAANGRLC